MALYQRLGLTPESVDLAAAERRVRNDEADRRAPHMVAYAHRSLPVGRGLLALAHYLRGDPRAAASVAARVAADVHDFYFGPWRAAETEAGMQDHAFWVREADGWGDAFRTALAWGAALGRWDDLRRLADYPTGDCRDDENGPGWKELYVAIAAHVRREAAERVTSLAKQVRVKGSPAILAEVLRALAARDANAFNVAFGRYLEHYKRKEFPRKSMLDKQSLLGTFFAHAADRAGLNVSRPPSSEQYLIDLSAAV